MAFKQIQKGEKMSISAKELLRAMIKAQENRLTGEDAAIAQRKIIKTNREGNQFIFKNH